MTSSQSPANEQPPAKKQPASGVWVIALVALGVLAGAGYWFSRGPADIANDDTVTGAEEEATHLASQNLDLNRVALASMENLETDDAETAWSSLSKARPEDLSIALNRALNRALTIDELSAVATDASAKPEEKQAARQRLAALLSETRGLIQKYVELGGDSNLATWMNARVDLNEAKLLPRSVMQSIRKEVFARLIESIQSTADSEGSKNNSILLAGTLTQVIDVLEDPIRGIPPTILAPAATTLTQLSNQQPNNLYLAVRAARLGIANQSKAAVDAIRRTQTLAASIEPTLRQQTAPIGKTPGELVDGIVASVEAGEFEAADNQMMLWFNLLNSTELIKTDRRRASPHPLDLIQFESLRRLSAQVSKQSRIPSASGALSFELESLSVEAAADSVDRKLPVPTEMVPIDANLDFRMDLVSMHPGEDSAQLLLWMQGDEGWKNHGTLNVDGQWTGMMVADLFMVDSSSSGRLRQNTTSRSHNTIRSLILYGDSGAQLVVVDGRDFGTPDATAERALKTDTADGLETLENVHTMLSGDFEGDGDLDLMVATQRGWELLVNRGNRTFFPLPTNDQQASSWDTNDPPVAFAIADLDRDLDLDIVTVHPQSGRVGWIENLLHLQFRFAYFDDIPVLPGVDSLAIEDIDGNVSWDIVLGSPEKGQLVLSHTGDIGVWRVDAVTPFTWPTTATPPQPSTAQPGSLIVADLDNDSFFECLRGGIASSAMELSPSSNSQDSPSAFGPQQELQWKSATDHPAVHIRSAVDFDGDLRLDLAGWSEASDSQASTISIASNSTELEGKAVSVRFKGIDDNNANSGRVNHYAVGSVLELRFGPHYRSRIVTAPTTHFGLDGLPGPGNLRVIFPNGLTQSVPEIEPGIMIEEEQTLKGSCPYLYAFNGERFEFVTDCLWAAPLGLQTSPGVVVPDRPWEHLLVEGKFLAPNDGAYELRITEELWEVAYFDQLGLSAIDHPQDIVVFTNEKVGPPSIAEPTIHAFDRAELRPVSTATDTAGTDVTSLLRETDGEHVQGFEHRYRQGLCPPHWIDLDLSDRVSNETSEEAKIHLVLNGWILPTDTSLNIQIDQNPELASPEPPSLWVPDEASESGWKMASPYIGFPGGKNKTIVVDVTDFMNRDDPRVRIRTTNQIYWDSAAVSVRSAAEIERLSGLVDVQPLQLQSADVAWHGFSRRIHPGSKQPETYDYQTAQDAPRWPPLDGPLTQYGPVEELIADWDDSMVVISGGDEIRLRFAVPKEPLAASKQRDFVLHGVGWDKDADLNTLAGQSTLPLPFQSMHEYPPTTSQLDEAIKSRQTNANHLSREQPFRQFWSRGEMTRERPSQAPAH
ncbi:FG-GAP-like repeat-containing protein [Rhodopirellula sp. P2]|uniref:FG-GAP-like repeat-containing protein n=1 Tax=Rhodopirellula sp. P2 TaxID=2127060 RepID=UPI0023680ED7|nr:FG-GAP-like repeat-containing protein [Rhodopirellula sp. P2]WDQ19289.1 FG-GAP-like repeat-containing protein [Rhodopirellula sp. P2]